MPSWVRSAGAWLSRFRWALWAFLGVALAAGLWALRRLTLSPAELATSATGPDPLAPIQEKVTRAEEQALVARVQATAKADADRDRLAETMKVEDGAERRRRLAEHLQSLR